MKSEVRHKPVIGLAGGVGAGKTAAAEQFARLGCAVIDSDRQAHEALNDPAVVRQVRKWWGDAVLDEAGRPSRKKLAEVVFRRPRELARLNGLIHPRVHRMRRRRLAELAGDRAVRAIVLDTPLLFEAGVDRECDVVVFVQAPRAERVRRLARDRGWSAAELDRRQGRQMDLRAKRARCDYVVTNDGAPGRLARQVARVLDEVLRRF